MSYQIYRVYRYAASRTRGESVRFSEILCVDAHVVLTGGPHNGVVFGSRCGIV